MTALERAKQFVRQNAARTALVILPLAAAAPATASSVTFDTVNATAVASGPAGVSVTAGAGAFTALPNGGVQFASVTDYVWFAFAGAAVATLLVYLIFNDRIEKGMTAGAVKG